MTLKFMTSVCFVCFACVCKEKKSLGLAKNGRHPIFRYGFTYIRQCMSIDTYEFMTSRRSFQTWGAMFCFSISLEGVFECCEEIVAVH